MRSEATLRAAVKSRPHDPTTHLQLAAWHVNWKELEKAADVLNSALEVDSAHAWRYHEMMGDIQYELLRDVAAAEKSYEQAIRGTEWNRTMFRYGTMRIWGGARAEADQLFAGAAASGKLRSVRQRPEVEFLPELPDQGFAISPSSHPLLEKAADHLKALLPAAQAEYSKWSKNRAKDAETDEHIAFDNQSKGRHMHFWIHRPRMERGIWRDACSHKTPKTCEILRTINASGLLVFKASFDVLEPGAVVRPHCHHTNRELFVDLALEVSEETDASLRSYDEISSISAGEVRVFDASHEHSETLQKDLSRNDLGDDSAGELKSRVLLRLVVRHPSAKWRRGDEDLWWEVLWRRVKQKFVTWFHWARYKIRGEL
eukprot:TRINITY_DN29157_c0_g2_i1.p1 TRINITY_DN29157_c0_g2~~TRINITY_DN29157_c0_g2_i1.p1  ORF type:complete len:420 (+),score=58.97 TRINITY_DN29157_c0_g2_i1:146-1261(+)